jgi:hypothetical protein
LNLKRNFDFKAIFTGKYDEDDVINTINSMTMTL